MPPVPLPVPCIQSIWTKTSFLLGLAPMAGRFTHGSAGYWAQPPKVAGKTCVLRCNPWVSHTSSSPSLSLSWTLVLATIAANVTHVWLFPAVAMTEKEAALVGRLILKLGLSQRAPCAPTKGARLTFWPFTDKGEENPGCPFPAIPLNLAASFAAA